jgi:transcriptional pleiotropic regulator of transition state genes
MDAPTITVQITAIAMPIPPKLPSHHTPVPTEDMPASTKLPPVPFFFPFFSIFPLTTLYGMYKIRSEPERGISMKSTGIVRKVDELGRIVLPIEMRRTLDISERDALEIYVEGTSIILKKHESACVFCGSVKNVSEFKGKNICAACLAELK